MTWRQKPSKAYNAAFHNFYSEPDMKKSSGFGRTRHTVGLDANHAEIVAAYESLYIQVIDYTMVGAGHPDIGIVGRQFGQRLREIKVPGAALEANQETFWKNWRGYTLKIITTVDEAYDDVHELNNS
jgi:hypothetical protein